MASHSSHVQETNISNMGNHSGNKRVAEDSLEKPPTKKRTAFGDLTNAVAQVLAAKKQAQITKKQEKKASRKQRSIKSIAEVETCGDENVKSSQETSSTDDDYTVCLSSQVSPSSDTSSDTQSLKTAVTDVHQDCRVLPLGVTDFDEESLGDPFSEPRYAMDIFNYYKSREVKFQLDHYMSRQQELSKGMRAVLADWLVEVQESFELNHETLYLAIKLVDLYLMKKTLAKTTLQLLGATAIFVACKFDERCPPCVDDFLYICDDAYTRSQLLHMEMDIIKTLDFDLGIPLSYRFLRRFARCSKVSMELLTLARYILESSLMEYDLVTERDSKMAAASLHLALRMKGEEPYWTPCLEYYSGYKEEELLDLERRLNRMIASPTYKNLSTVKTKYSHRVFHEVAKIPSLPLDYA